jgi:hypothetical protein
MPGAGRKDMRRRAERQAKGRDRQVKTGLTVEGGTAINGLKTAMAQGDDVSPGGPGEGRTKEQLRTGRRERKKAVAVSPRRGTLKERVEGGKGRRPAWAEGLGCGCRRLLRSFLGNAGCGRSQGRDESDSVQRACFRRNRD